MWYCLNKRETARQLYLIHICTYEVLIGRATAAQAIRHTEYRTDVIGSNTRLAGPLYPPLQPQAQTVTECRLKVWQDLPSGLLR